MAAWWTNPQGKRLLVLDVSSSLEDGAPDDYQCYVVEMDVALADAILRRMDLVKAWHARDSDLLCAQFWDYRGEYYGRRYDSDAVDADGNGPPLWVRGESDGRTDTDRLEIGCSGGERAWAEWKAYVKHTDIRLSTEVIDEAELRQCVAGEDPWLSAPVDEEAALNAKVEATVENFREHFKAPEPVPPVLKGGTE